VLASVEEHGVGRTSGVVVERQHYAVWTLNAGQIVRLRVYLDRNEALAATGLGG
jgi:ketosteroid isomerase-like protein